MRLGWVVAPRDIMEPLVIAKQASDLHSKYLSQRIAYQYLLQQNIDDHIRKICTVYKTQCQCMIDITREKFPESIHYTVPEGGMFIWLTLPGANCLNQGIRTGPQGGCCRPSRHTVLYRWGWGEYDTPELFQFNGTKR